MHIRLGFTYLAALLFCLSGPIVLQASHEHHHDHDRVDNDEHDLYDRNRDERDFKRWDDYNYDTNYGNGQSNQPPYDYDGPYYLERKDR